MNAATAQMVTLTGQGDDTDHNAVGAAVNTISNNLPEMAKGVKMLAALMDDEGANGDDLMGAARNLCSAFSDLLSATEPQSHEPRQHMLSAASQVGSASHRVLYTIGEEEVADKERQQPINYEQTPRRWRFWTDGDGSCKNLTWVVFPVGLRHTILSF